MIRDKSRQKRRVVTQEQRPAKPVKPANSNTNYNNGVYYSFLTVILLLCLIQITASAVLNISKIISYKAKIIQITKTRDTALALNETLKDNIKNFSNVSGIEAIARNNLKMSSDDEVLVIINTPKEEPEPKNTGFFDLIKKKIQ